MFSLNQLLCKFSLKFAMCVTEMCFCVYTPRPPAQCASRPKLRITHKKTFRFTPKNYIIMKLVYFSVF